MTESNAYRRVPAGQVSPQAVTVGIEANVNGQLRAAVWWEAKGDVDADEAEYGDIAEAFRAAEAAKELHGFEEVVVVLTDFGLWRAEWGTLLDGSRENEPIGDISTAELSSDEVSELALNIEIERDA